MGIMQVLRYLPHRYPFLLVDRVLELEPGVSLRGLKNVSFNDPFFLGHFPQQPVMPGVLILEALAQATGILAFKTSGEMPEDSSTYYFVGIDNARFKQPVVPGDQLILDVRLLKTKRGIWVFSGEATVDGKVVCSAELMSTKREHGQ